MQTSRHWLIGSALGCLLAATLAVLADAALPPAAPRPAPLPLPPLAAGVVSPFAGGMPATATDASAAPAGTAPLPPPTAAPPLRVELGPDTGEFQTLVDELANRPSVDAALDREMRDALLADMRERLQHLRANRGDAAEVAQLERLIERLQRLP